MIRYMTGDATRPHADGNKIICHVCNDIGGWGAGFVLAISKRWVLPEQAYRQWYAERQQNDFALGRVQFVQVEADVWVANMIGQHGIRRTGGQPPIRYEAIEAALAAVADHAKTLGASVHMPRIGCGLAGGKWERVESIIDQTLCANETEVFVYDLSG